MTLVAKLGGVSTLRPKAVRLRGPPLRMFLAASLSNNVGSYALSLNIEKFE